VLLLLPVEFFFLFILGNGSHIGFHFCDFFFENTNFYLQIVERIALKFFMSENWKLSFFVVFNFQTVVV
jgi:hypothetical protein